MTRFPIALVGLALSLLACVGFKDGAAGGDSGRDFDLDDDGFSTPVDCDDADPDIHPDALEVCDGAGVDEDCDGLVDDADDSVDPAGFASFYPDADGDGYGDPAGPLVDACAPPRGYSDNGLDCDDDDAARNPDSGCLGGTFSGEVRILLDAFITTDTCVGTLFVDVSERAQPQVSGEGTCTFEGFFSTFGENDIALTGALSGSAMSGDVGFSILDDTTFTGAIQGQRMTVQFTGITVIEGFPVTYTADLVLTQR